MYFAEYYQKSAKVTRSGTRVIADELVPGCGDRSVYILDGRSSLAHLNADAEEFGKRHNWLAYRICKGETFCRCKAITGIMRVR